MPERSLWSAAQHAWQRLQQTVARTPRLLAVAGLVAATVAACTESYDGGGDACPSLCPATPLAFRDTTIDAVVFDTAVGGYPALGLSSALLLANRPDTLVTRGVLRYDILPTSFNPNKGSATENITTIDSATLVLPLDSTGARGATPVTVEVFDVDTTQNDSSSVVIKTLFRKDRLLGSTIMTPKTQGDTLRVPLSNSALAAKITANARLRVGLRISGGSGQIRIIAFSGGAGAPYVRFDPKTDTTYAPLTVSTTTTIDYATTDMNLSYQAYALIDKGSSAPDASTLQVGGYPSYRTYLRFKVPAAISDSSTIVRAEVLFTQRPSTFANTTDSVYILPMVPAASNTVTDLRRILDLTAEGIFAALDSSRLVPKDSGLKVINVLTLARGWKSLPADVPRAVAFRIGLEGSQPSELRFFSSKASAALRPRLRLTYQPRNESAIP